MPIGTLAIRRLEAQILDVRVWSLTKSVASWRRASIIVRWNHIKSKRKWNAQIRKDENYPAK